MAADKELKDLINKLIADKAVMDLVKIMKPFDVVAIITTDLELQDEEAENVFANLIQHAHNSRFEGISLPGTNQYPYPVPSNIKRDNQKLEEDGIDMDPNEFPPPSHAKSEDWPYDVMTKAVMDPQTKGRKRPLMQGPFDPKLKKNVPGGDAAANGIYSRNPPHADNSMSSSGRSFDASGRPGWSSSPPGKEFDLPDEIGGPSPVGSSIPQFHGGHNQQRKMGFRRR